MTKETMTIRRFAFGVVLAGFVLGLAFGFGPGVHADVPGQHPHYLHALSDLRYSRGWLTVTGESGVVGREKDAIGNIDKAMFEIRRAGIDDGKDLRDHPPLDASLKHKGRLHRALDLVRSARKDLGFEEDDKAALGWRKEAIKHVDKTVTLLNQAIKDAGDEI